MKSALASFLSLTAVIVGQTVPIDQLAHKVPSTAAREYRASTKALEKGRLEESIAHCRKALDADPENASAHNDLGVLYLNDGQTEKAREEFQRAAALRPGMTMAHVNESFALLALERPREAEVSARKALEIAPHDRRANLLLGWSLTAQSLYSEEALASLQSASREYPEAHLAAADVLLHTGALGGARKEVEFYLASGNTDQQKLAEAWLRLLTIQ